ncbi:MAG: four helix bundle protein [Halothece sp. Uz-M2-17]|nr:four helix bundle protein [Halothece sp. Uz-M2-17]
MAKFSELRVYQLAEELANQLWVIVAKWDYFAKNTVGKQIIRSADSIGANIAEGNGRYNYKDNQRFIKIARGSLYETRHWLRLAYNHKLLTEEEINQIKPLIEELSPKLNAYLNSIKKHEPITNNELGLE